MAQLLFLLLQVTCGDISGACYSMILKVFPSIVYLITYESGCAWFCCGHGILVLCVHVIMKVMWCFIDMGFLLAQWHRRTWVKWISIKLKQYTRNTNHICISFRNTLYEMGNEISSNKLVNDGLTMADYGLTVDCLWTDYGLIMDWLWTDFDGPAMADYLYKCICHCTFCETRICI